MDLKNFSTRDLYMLICYLQEIEREKNQKLINLSLLIDILYNEFVNRDLESIMD